MAFGTAMQQEKFVTLIVTKNEEKNQWHGHLVNGDPDILFIHDKFSPSVPQVPGVYQCQVALDDDGRWFCLGMSDFHLFRLIKPVLNTVDERTARASKSAEVPVV